LGFPPSGDLSFACGPSYDDDRHGRSCQINQQGQTMTKFDITKKYVRDPDLLSVDMDGDMVMLSIETGNYFGVSGVGPFIWELMGSPQTLGQLVDAVCAEFEVDAETASVDIETFLGNLRQNGMIEAT